MHKCPTYIAQPSLDKVNEAGHIRPLQRLSVKIMRRLAAAYNVVIDYHGCLQNNSPCFFYEALTNELTYILNQHCLPTL